MLIVTGGAGFIGSQVVRALNAAGRRDLLVVDDLRDGRKFLNLRDRLLSDYLDVEEFSAALERDALPEVEAVFHQGACADTAESDGRFMLRNNFTFSKRLLRYCLERKVTLVYASSAAVYGANRACAEAPANERPLNVYGYSKLLFDQYARRLMPEAGSTVVGLRYFNVYGPGEAHKSRMASMPYQLYRQLRTGGAARLFAGADGCADGEQRRDFVNVSDVARVNLFFAFGEKRTGVFNVGTGCSRSFNEVARALIGMLGEGRVEYIPFPEALRGKYQSFTEAEMSALRQAGYRQPFLSLEDGLRAAAAEWNREDDARS